MTEPRLSKRIARLLSMSYQERYLLRQRCGGAALGESQLFLQPRALALQVAHLQHKVAVSTRTHPVPNEPVRSTVYRVTPM